MREKHWKSNQITENRIKMTDYREKKVEYNIGFGL